MLAVAELGAGSAIVYSMYRPILDGDRQKVATLYRLYERVYRIIGATVFGMGLLVMPFLSRLIGDYETLEINVYATFFLTLVSSSLSYLYGAKTSLIEAYKDNWLTTGILTVCRLVTLGLQAAAILMIGSYTAYLMCLILETLAVWRLTEVVVRRRHANVITLRETLDPMMRSEVEHNVHAMFMHRIGTVLVNGVDSLVISSFIGVVVLGKYSNYALIAGVLSGTLSLCFSSLTSVVGHLCAKGDVGETKRWFDRFWCLNYALGVVFFLGYFAVIDAMVAFCFGGEQGMGRAVVFIVTLNQFTQFMRRTQLLYHSAAGLFYYDRRKPIVEGVVNIALSLLFVNMLPGELRVAGVILATIITTLLICDVVEPWVVFRHVFDERPGAFYVRAYGCVAVFVAGLVVMDGVMLICDNYLLGIVANGSLSLLVSFCALALVAAVDGKFRTELVALLKAVF